VGFSLRAGQGEKKVKGERSYFINSYMKLDEVLLLLRQNGGVSGKEGYHSFVFKISGRLEKGLPIPKSVHGWRGKLGA